jgi:heptosyltransferase-2
VPENRICVLSLEAMGAVLRSTCLLPAIKRKYPGAHITWITLPQCKALLQNNRHIDRILTLSPATLSVIEQLGFDVLYAVDKSMEAGALAEKINAKEKFGFGLSKEGAIIPLSPEADYQYEVGLDDELKFFKNEKAETQQITETMGLEWKRDEYILDLTDEEKALSKKRRKEVVPSSAKGVIGYNTGCSLLFPYKKFTVERAVEVVREWRKTFPGHAVALLGGPEDTERQIQIKQSFKDDAFVINTPTTEGLRSGIVWMDIADTVLSGCSLGMHIAIGLKKHITAWFGVSCLQEVDLYDRGDRLQSDVSCSPCWKKSCDQDVKCFDKVEPKIIMESTQRLLTNLDIL